MAEFRVVLVEHGYPSSELEQRIVERAGGEFIDADGMPIEEALRLCEDADGILVRRIEVGEERMRRFRRCKILVRYGVGTDNIDARAATEAGIIVGHVPTYCVDEVSTHAFGLLLGCIRAIPRTHASMSEGAWDLRRTIPIMRSEDRTLGIVGLGQIGQSLARKAAGWGWRLIGVDPYADPKKMQRLGVELTDPQTLCRESDFISLHLPLLPETKHMFGRAQFEQMKPDSILINTARGPIVDTRALREAIDSKRIGMAALDVFEEEPLPADSPLRGHPRILLTDHMAWYSEQSQIDLQTRAAEEIVRVCTGGLPRSLANYEVLQRLGREEEFTPPETLQWQLKRIGIINEKI